LVIFLTNRENILWQLNHLLCRATNGKYYKKTKNGGFVKEIHQESGFNEVVICLMRCIQIAVSIMAVNRKILQTFRY
jgi:hypothetical protein